jgi:hypothetical protein
MLTYTKVENLKWADQEQTVLDCEVWFDHAQGATPFTANPSDSAAHSQDILQKAIAGVFGPITNYVAPEPVPTPATAEIPVVNIL